MTNNKKVDEVISKFVQSVENQIPSAVEKELRIKTYVHKPEQGIWLKKMMFPLGAFTGVAMIITLVLLLFSPIQKPLDTQINEIYTEFEIRDKNIQIIFVQRKDFNLFMEEENE